MCILSISETKATVNDLIRANTILNSAKKSWIWNTFCRLNQANLSLAVFLDASLRYLLDGGSQGLFVVDNVGNRNPLMWTSKRIKRLVKSTLAAETLSLVEAA